MSSKLDNYELSFPQLPKPASVLYSHATVIVSKVLDALSDPLKRKAAINQITGHELVRSVKPINDKWYINMDKSATEDFCLSIHNIISGTTTKVVSKRFFVYHVIFLPMLTLRYSEANTVSKMLKDWAYLNLKLEFLDSFAQSTFFKHGLRVGYESFLFTSLKTYPNADLNADH